MKNPKLFLGPMSKNIVDNVISLNLKGYSIGLIPSRRQIDFKGGYVNKWTTEEFVKYVKQQCQDIIICRDHGGPKQGSREDFGITSFINDCQYMDIIHIDPWKLDEGYIDCYQHTANLINFCYSINPNIMFEIGTEEDIRKFNPNQFMYMLVFLKKNVKCFQNIKYAVIQSGTNLKLDMNTGKYEEDKLKNMIEICKFYGVLSKEHNGDYLDSKLIKSKFDKGLDSINIAPEFGRMETECYLELMNDQQKEEFFWLCYDSLMWCKWLKGDDSFNPFQNKEKIIQISGHYVFSNSIFLEKFSNLDIKKKLFNKMEQRINDILGDL